MDRRLNRFTVGIIVLALLFALAGAGCSVAKKIEPVKQTTSKSAAQNASDGVQDQFIAKTKQMNVTLQEKLDTVEVKTAGSALNITAVTLDDRYLPALADQLTRYGREVAEENSLDLGTFEISIPNGGISWKSAAADWQTGQFENVRANYRVNYSLARLYGHYGSIGRGLVQ